MSAIHIRHLVNLIESPNSIIDDGIDLMKLTPDQLVEALNNSGYSDIRIKRVINVSVKYKTTTDKFPRKNFKLDSQ